MGADVLVVDESGKDWVSGDLTITGTTLTAPLAPDMPDAGYQVRWRVVSGDGHPISSVIPFTVGDGEPYVSATPSPEVSFQADADADAEVEATADRDQAPELWQLALLGIGGAAGAVLLFVLFSFLNRRRRARSDDETRRPMESSDNFERHDS
ncbi:copper resistance CopC family protein [Microbacterium sp. HM-570]